MFLESSDAYYIVIVQSSVLKCSCSNSAIIHKYNRYIVLKQVKCKKHLWRSVINKALKYNSSVSVFNYVYIHIYIYIYICIYIYTYTTHIYI